MGPHTPLRLAADLPVAARRTDHLQAVLDELTSDQIAERLVGFRRMLADLPAGDAMRPTVEALRDVLAAELAGRIAEQAGN